MYVTFIEHVDGSMSSSRHVFFLHVIFSIHLWLPVAEPAKVPIRKQPFERSVMGRAHSKSSFSSTWEKCQRQLGTQFWRKNYHSLGVVESGLRSKECMVVSGTSDFAPVHQRSQENNRNKVRSGKSEWIRSCSQDMLGMKSENQCDHSWFRSAVQTRVLSPQIWTDLSGKKMSTALCTGSLDWKISWIRILLLCALGSSGHRNHSSATPLQAPPLLKLCAPASTFYASPRSV